MSGAVPVLGPDEQTFKIELTLEGAQVPGLAEKLATQADSDGEVLVAAGDYQEAVSYISRESGVPLGFLDAVGST